MGVPSCQPGAGVGGYGFPSVPNSQNQPRREAGCPLQRWGACNKAWPASHAPVGHSFLLQPCSPAPSRASLSREQRPGERRAELRGEAATGHTVVVHGKHEGLLSSKGPLEVAGFQG